MVSLPVEVAYPRKTTLFPTSTSRAFAYQSGYVAKDTMVKGVGYWLKFDADQEIGVQGSTITCDTIEIVPGWNLIGAIGAPIGVNSIVSIPPVATTSSFFGYSGSYFRADSLYPGKAYWVNPADSVQLIFFSSPSSSA